LADRLYYMDEGGLTEYLGNYDYFEEKRPDAKPSAAVTKAPKVDEYKLRKERESEARKRKGKIERTEKRLEEISAQLDELNTMMSTPEYASDYEKVMELTAQINTLTAEEEDLYSLLEELYEQSEN
ncbi:MAG: ABC transporter ATP-binding protein, partial [Clostridia bacterium]|nr:ABC transporter ATP-binding protein [Clostridia bacterium]